ncbi:hypothetical protein ACFWB2_12420 [Streptomyces virginiae]
MSARTPVGTPFTDTHALTVAGWPTSAQEVALWCGRQEFRC